MQIGPLYMGNNRCEFRVWAPFSARMALKIVSPEERIIPLLREAGGYWSVVAEGVGPGARYLFVLEDGRERPDPASRYQPEGVHGPSEVVDHAGFQWEDENWRGINIPDMILYELHVGTYTSRGDFDSIIPMLDELKKLGVNTLELMPVGQFPGERNWGYDGSYPFAVQNSYGGPEGLKRLVNACHKKGLAVVLDAVYNHFGPEGSYVSEFGPYFTGRYKTPWGDAVNFDDEYCGGVRNFFIENALSWFRDYHFDGLRLDAVHAIYDFSARPFLLELSSHVKHFSDRTGGRHYIFAESDLNDARVITPEELGGYGLDAQWCDDYHHALHALLTDEREGYYADFGTVGDLAKALREGFVYSGRYSKYRKRNHGSSSRGRPSARFIVFSQNHDQTGNRLFGERLSTLVSFEALKLAAAAVIFSPFIPLLFMGEEYGETAPFLYFVDHEDEQLVEAVRQGRKEEFRHFHAGHEVPDPKGSAQFHRSVPDRGKMNEESHKVLLSCYRRLIGLRREIPALGVPDKENLDACAIEGIKVVFMQRRAGESHVCCIFNFSREPQETMVPIPGGEWRKRFDSADPEWNGPGSRAGERLTPADTVSLQPQSCLLYCRRADVFSI